MPPQELPEIHEIRSILVVNQHSTCYLEHRYSFWNRLNRVTAYLLRWCHNVRANMPEHRRVGPLSVLELDKATISILKNVQGSAFEQEILDLKTKKLVGRRSALRSLNPFLDTCGLVQVGGRLANSDMDFGSKFPIALSAKSKITQLILEYEHKRLLHIGPQGLLANIHQQYWPLRGRAIARKIVKNCIICFRSNPTLITPFMVPLPRARVIVERPFARTGVDFCGPILVRSGLRRIVKIKCYSSFCMLCDACYPFGIGKWSYRRCVPSKSNEIYGT